MDVRRVGGPTDTGWDMGGHAGSRRWTSAVLVGSVVGALGLALVAVLRQQPWVEFTLFGAGIGGVVGVVFALAGRDLDRTRPTAGEGDPYLNTLERSEVRVLRRAAFRGPVPTDPERRAAAIRLIRRTMDIEIPRRLRSLTSYGLWCLFGAVSAIGRSPWFLTYVAVALGLFVWTLRRPGRLRRRLAELRSATDQPAMSRTG